MTGARIHHLRALARRLRVCLELAFTTLNDPLSKKAVRTVKRHLRFLGSLRDTQVQLKRLAIMSRTLHGLGPVVRNREREEHRLQKKVKSLRLRRLDGPVRKVESLLRARPDNAATERMSIARLTRFISAAQRQVSVSRTFAAAGPDELHRARIALKRLVLLGEALPTLFRTTVVARMDDMRDELTLLGSIHDLDVFSEWLGARRHRKNLNPKAARRLHARLLLTRDRDLEVWVVKFSPTSS
jgi:CHAD domain-containing protein